MAGTRPIQGPFAKLEPGTVRMANEFNLRVLPDDPIAAIGELVAIARQLDDITDPAERRGGGMYTQAGPKEDAIKSAAVLAWGQDVWSQVEAAANVASPDGPEMVDPPRETAEERERRKANQGKETTVEDPGIATMSLQAQTAEREGVAAGLALVNRRLDEPKETQWMPPKAKPQAWYDGQA